jgi:hypothetical protein
MYAHVVDAVGNTVNQDCAHFSTSKVRLSKNRRPRLRCSTPELLLNTGVVPTTRFNTKHKPPSHNVSMRDDLDRLELRGQSLKKGISIWNMKSTGKVILFHGE